MTAIGLILALFGPLAVALIGPKLTGAFGTVFASLIGAGGFVAIVGVIFAIVYRSEHRSVSSLGFQALRWQSPILGLGLSAFFMYVFTPAVSWVLARLPLEGFETGLARASATPTWLLVVTILVVATAEEVLYRGYAVERLADIVGNYWAAGAISVLAFGIAHIPNWGLGVALSTLASGAVMTAFFIWQRDLMANIVAHVVTDLMGLVVMPSLTAGRIA
jgi:membrane protease YdiL (CAAX protease family)